MVVRELRCRLLGIVGAMSYHPFGTFRGPGFRCRDEKLSSHREPLRVEAEDDSGPELMIESHDDVGHAAVRGHGPAARRGI